MPLSQRLPRAAWSVLLDQALDGMRQGGVPPWPAGRWPRLRRRLEQQWLGPIWGTWGDQVSQTERWPEAVRVLLQWTCGLVRPDHQLALGIGQIPDTAWVEQTAWRPLLAVAATSNLLPVPDMPRHYRRTTGENALETLSGLWAVGTSTTYRYVDKGRRQMVDALAIAQIDADRRWALREVAFTARLSELPVGWHSEISQSLAQHGHAMDAAWHLCRARQWTSLAELLRRRALELASSPEHNALSQTLRRADVELTSRVELALGESVMWRCLGDTDAEGDCLRLALRTAESVNNDIRALHIAEALYGMGYFYNARDPEQAHTHLEAACQQILVASHHVSHIGQARLQSVYVSALAAQAFIQLRRNNPQALSLLKSALSAANECEQLTVDAQCILLKAQAEAARCNDQLSEALRFRQQALVLYERAGDLREVLDSKVNLGQLLTQLGKAKEGREICEQVLKMAQSLSVRPEALLSAYVGLALADMTLGDLDSAVLQLNHVVRISQQFGLARHQLSGLMNLAEVHFLRMKQHGGIDDERLGDQYAKQARELAARLGLTQQEAKAQSLKQATLNPQTAVHHLLPIETSAHPGEFAKIEALRAELALPRPPAQRARTHIALSQLYLRIAAKERDAARGLMQTHGLSDLESELEALQQTWAHDGNLASRLSQRWREQVGDWLTDAQRKAVLARLLEEGSLSKSSYGEAAEVSPATASKHLGLLADKGLLEQQGRGPATRYVLPAAAAAAPPVH
jgi:tetratricopeptide (TPR) repeat protein